jgi:quercetin dioxygenase-like cupin family protein
MHIGPADFRSIKRDGLLVRFAILADVAYVLAEAPPAGSSGTLLEEACERPHWAFVVSGEVEVVGPGRVTVPAGSAWHVPAGASHRITAAGRTRLAGFERIDAPRDVTDAGLRAKGFEIVSDMPGPSRGVAPVIDPGSLPVELGEIRTSGTQMGNQLFCQTRFGPRSGYASPFCDLEHWGLVTAGNIAIEWENDIEVLTAGDVFYCPPGPPGHRFQAADPSATVDFTPLDAFARGGRVVEWRRALATTRARKDKRREVKVAPLV